jgi:hypothetical protein
MAVTMKPRYIIIGLALVIVISVGLNIFFAIRYQDTPTALTAEYPFLDPAQATYNNADLLVNMYPLAQELKGLTQNNSNVEIYFQFLNTESDIRINSTPFYPGSLMTIPIAMAVMQKIDSGEWSMSDKLTLTDADKNPNYGNLYELPAGTTFTVSALLNDLLVQSDDTARDIFVRSLGDQDIENVLTYVGLQDVVNTSSEITAQRYSNFWRALYSAGYLSADSSQGTSSNNGASTRRRAFARGIAFKYNIFPQDRRFRRRLFRLGHRLRSEPPLYFDGGDTKLKHC